jgi:hypothetical protein
MGVLKQNALALRPGETVTRVECLWRKDLALTVERVETVELPELGYYYVSRLVPTQVLLDKRSSAGHEPPKGSLCSLIPWREVRPRALEPGAWRAIIDFYARHNCDQYPFWQGYQPLTTEGALPAIPEAALVGEGAPAAPVGEPGAAPVGAVEGAPPAGTP